VALRWEGDDEHVRLRRRRRRWCGCGCSLHGRPRLVVPVVPRRRDDGVLFGWGSGR
jgi:hypothetical protein